MGSRAHREIQEQPVLLGLEATLAHLARQGSVVSEAVQEVKAAKALLDSRAVQGLLAFQEQLVHLAVLDWLVVLQIQVQLDDREVQVDLARLAGGEIPDRLETVDP